MSYCDDTRGVCSSEDSDRIDVPIVSLGYSATTRRQEVCQSQRWIFLTVPSDVLLNTPSRIFIRLTPKVVNMMLRHCR